MDIKKRSGFKRMLRAGSNILQKGHHALRKARALGRYRKYNHFTMVPRRRGVANLLLCQERAPSSGCIVECGVWRGGMSAAMADTLPGRMHFLFDSFEGMPEAKEIDGPGALDYQRNKTSPWYRDNCRVESSFAEKAMQMSAAKRFNIIQGWFSETLPGFVLPEPIAVLRLDADWYESTKVCLDNFYPKVMPGGLIILDDYYSFDGCSRAVHDYLSIHKTIDRIYQFKGVPYLIKPTPNWSMTAAEIHVWGNRKAVVANFKRWAAYGWGRDLRNEPDFPANIWAYARKRSSAGPW
jgi:O-methyltransferase